MDILDGFEGESRHYVRLGIPFIAKNTEKLQLGHVYIAHPNKLTDDALVNDHYLNIIRQGYLQHGFDADF